MKMLLFKPELGTLTRIDYPEAGHIVDLVEDDAFHGSRIVIDKVPYILYVGFNSSLKHSNLWSFYQVSTDKCLYGNIVIEKTDNDNNSKDITAEDILSIRSHIMVRSKGYMIYLD